MDKEVKDGGYGGARGARELTKRCRREVKKNKKGKKTRKVGVGREKTRRRKKGVRVDQKKNKMDRNEEIKEPG